MPDFNEEFPPLVGGEISKNEASSTKEQEEDWQIVSTGDEDDDHAENDVSFTGDGEQETKAAVAVIVQGNPKMLRHCASSPDFRTLHHISEDEDKVEDSSFAMLSNVGSVMSVASGSSAWASGRSFRDAFLASPVRNDNTNENETTEESTGTSSRPFRKPKIVVTVPSPIRRCSQSSPNLLGLIHENDDEIMGETDANDFYHRKSKGAQGRVNGLKLRPDEAKRKAFAVNKRNMQRQGK